MYNMYRTRVVFKGKLLVIQVKKVILPNGHIAKLEIVRHPGAVLIIPFLRRDKIILLRQLRPVINSYIYELPAGTLDENERPLSCARREIREEIGYTAKRFEKLGVIFTVPGYSTEKIIIYKAEGLTKREKLAQKDELIEDFIVTKRKVRELFKKGKIVDAKTICALAFCGWV